MRTIKIIISVAILALAFGFMVGYAIANPPQNEGGLLQWAVYAHSQENFSAYETRNITLAWNHDFNTTSYIAVPVIQGTDGSMNYYILVNKIYKENDRVTFEIANNNPADFSADVYAISFGG